jgi:hypothetical protein
MPLLNFAALLFLGTGLFFILRYRSRPQSRHLVRVGYLCAAAAIPFALLSVVLATLGLLAHSNR